MFKQRMSFAYIERAEAEKLLQEGIGIVNSLNWTWNSNKEINTFKIFKNSVVKKKINLTYLHRSSHVIWMAI